MKAKQMYANRGDDIGLQNLIESQKKFNDIKNHTIPEIRNILGNVAQTIVQLYELCENEGLTRNDSTQVVVQAFPDMDKNDRSKMKVYHENFDAIIKHFKSVKSTSISVDYMVKTWRKAVAESKKTKNAELLALQKNKRDVAQDKKKQKTVGNDAPINATDRLSNLGHAIADMERCAKSGSYTNEELENIINGFMASCEVLENCKVQIKLVATG